MSISVYGFSPENIERIYLGDPALTASSGKLAGEVLGDKEYEVAYAAAVKGLSNREIAAQTCRHISTITSQLYTVYGKLGIYSRYSLAAFFPLDPGDAPLEDKTLSQLTTRQLQVIEGISKGMSLKTVAADLNLQASTTRGHIGEASKIWPDCAGSLRMTRVANSLRSVYAREFINSGKSMDSLMGGFALHKLVRFEPEIRSTFGMPEAIS